MSRRHGARRGIKQQQQARGAVGRETVALAAHAESVGEMIGRTASVSRLMLYGASVSVDWTRTDYAYWDKLHRGKLPTLRLGGLFAKPMVEHVRSWTLGAGFEAKTEHARTDKVLAEFIAQSMRVLLSVVSNMLRLGDSYVVINADGTLTEVSPDLVDVITDPLDYRHILGYKITTRLDTATIVDEYRADMRTVTITLAGKALPPQTFRNFSGRIPVVHFAHERGVNEVFGHPMVEALLQAFMEYDDVLDKSLQGVKAMGTPFPVMENVANVEKTLTDLAKRSAEYIDADGTTRTGAEVDFGTLDMIVTDGTFNLKGPNPFTDDSWRVLKNLFLLFLQHGNIPEWVWGGAIASSKASVEAQMPAFSKFIEAIQEALSDPLGALCEVWLAVVSLYTPRVKALPVTVSYPPVASDDKAEQRERIKQAAASGLITRATELRLLDLGIEDVEAEVKAAEAEASERSSQAQQIDAWAMTPAGAQADEDAVDDGEDEPMQERGAA